ncbi:sensor histidine kinase [Pseudobacteroides cellulosolvens]|uniref:histidine kinase n=1 Tax=Pseudobacteroides cellulosolvens ATCC 35603 = DSM 2933 TaxID=398512 RepID=A0A0L6JWF4_9FIRM|nr:HAMP domain-containing sensor histidine kinase [Pseudobacteroides cellulosolvens]KNY30069.1 ATP-binding region ATPase domain protein [Pseudobacteroides cellulosolvens ATCC 35603 = DSM 2933]
MLFIWISLWTLSFIIVKVNDENKEMKWIASLCFFSGLGALCSILRKQVYPSLNLNPNIKLPIKYTIFYLHSLSYVLSPYSMSVYSVISSKWLIKKTPFFCRHAKKILLIPPVLMYLIYPVQFRYKAPFFALSLWVVPYCIFSNALLIITFLKERNTVIKRQKLFTCLIITPPTVFDTISNYVMTAMGNHLVWKYNSVTVFVLVSIFIVASAKYGVMGIKIRFEKSKLESTRKSVTSGTALLTHTLKNEITKISICTNNLRHCINNSQDAEYIRKVTQEDFKLIDLSFSHLINMMKTINEHLTDISINPVMVSLNKLVDESLTMIKPDLDKKGITVKKSVELEASIECDPIHIKETFINVFKNSIEAMSQEGYLSVHIYRESKWTVVEVTDNGSGIDSNNLAYVFEPFFSTKKTGLNYGLGLSYCYNVMKQHEGKLEISSRKGFGTSVYLNFNNKKAHAIKAENYNEVMVYGENKSFTC